MEENVRYILCDNSGAILYCYYTLGLEEVMYKAEKLLKNIRYTCACNRKYGNMYS